MLKKSVHGDFAYTVSCYVPRGRSPATLYMYSELRPKTFFENEDPLDFSRGPQKLDRNLCRYSHL